MNTGQKVAIGGTVAMALAVGIELLWMHHERASGWKQPAAVDYGPTDPDDLVFLKKKRPYTLADIRQLDGTTVWVSAGGQLNYYLYAAHRAEYAKSAGTLLGAEPLVIKDAFEQVAPKDATFRIPGGDRQVLVAFTMPHSADPARQYAVPVGYRQGHDYTFYTDEIFFYDDPHQLYSFWGPQIWQAVDAHQVILGMTEHEVEMALGQVSKSDSKDYGNRLVEFANVGHPMAVTFAKNHVTAFRPEQDH